MDAATLRRRSELLRGCAAMGGFAVTLPQAERAVLESDTNKAEGNRLTFDKSLARVQQRRQAGARIP